MCLPFVRSSRPDRFIRKYYYLSELVGHTGQLENSMYAYDGLVGAGVQIAAAFLLQAGRSGRSILTNGRCP